MASSVQDGGQKSKELSFRICQQFYVLSFAISFYFDQQNYPKSYFAKLISQKWWTDPRWRIEIRFLSITRGIFNIFSILLLQLFCVSKTHILWFFKKSKMKVQNVFIHLEIDLTFFSTNKQMQN
jgi:hypothetical protein